MEAKSSTSNEYLKTKVLTASPEKLQLMLYDGAIRFCEQARSAILERKIEDSFNGISKAEKIIMELALSMKDEIAPETCAKMRSLYMFIYDRLVTANISKELEPLDDALRVIRHIRETWLLLMEKLQEERGGAASAAYNVEIPAPNGQSRTIGSIIFFRKLVLI